MAKIKIKGSFSDLKPALSSLKSLMESQEDDYLNIPKERNVELQQEIDLKNIKQKGYSNNL